jgi:alpha-L-fucosidase 2
MIPLAEMTPELAPLGYADPVVTVDGDLHIMAQQVPEGPAFAMAWNPSGTEFFVAVMLGNDVEQASNDASEGVKRALDRGYLTLLAEHNALWEAFWAVSEVHLPEPRMEFLWRYGIYILASCSHPGHAPPGLQGLWAMDGVLPPWHGDYHADMNVQEIFWPACASGHLELLDTWCDLMKAEIPLAQAFTRRFFGTEGTFRPGTSLPEFTSVPCWYTVEYAWSHSGWLAWLVWLRWRYSMDRAWLAETGYPVVAEIFRFYRANLEEGEDGRLHVPLSNSPEYREDKPEAWASDPNIDLALIRRCCVWVTEMEAALGVEELSADAARIREQLAPYALTDDGALCLWKDKPLDDPHRHPSHLMAIHPAMDITIEGSDEDRRIIDASIRQYHSLGQYLWAGHTYAQLISFAAVTGRTGWAYQSLRMLADHWLGPNGLHFNQDFDRCGMSGYAYPAGVYGPFTIEANCAAAAGISDMLVQGWGDCIRVFPAVPDEWKDAAFRGLLTEGAFKVSAVRRDGQTVWVKVVATVAGKVVVRDPFGGEKAVGIRCDERCKGCEAGCYVAELGEGEAMVLAREGVEVEEGEIAGMVRPWEGPGVGLR